MSDEEIKVNNVVDLASKKNPTQPRNAAYAKQELKKALHNVGVFNFPVVFRVVQQKDGARIRFLEKPNGETLLDIADLGLSHIAKWCANRAVTEKCFSLSKDDMKKVLDVWTLEAEPIEMPDIIKFQHEGGRCLRRLPFTVAHGDSPLFDELLSRMSNRKAVMAYIWSIFERDSYDQQFLWVQGEGQDGKGTLGRWFEKILTASNFISMNEFPKSTKYLTHLLIGKRLAFVSDNRDQNLPLKSLFISITGGDLQLAENKWITAFMTKLECKFIIMSNPDPNITREKSILRRLIFARITPPKEMTLTHRQYENGLYSESSAFLSKCRDAYQDLCPNHEQIRSEDNGQVEELAANTEAHFDGLFESRFRLGGEIRASQLAEIVRQLFSTKAERDDFYRYIRQRLNTKPLPDKTLNVRFWKGFAPKFQ